MLTIDEFKILISKTLVIKLSRLCEKELKDYKLQRRKEIVEKDDGVAPDKLENMKSRDLKIQEGQDIDDDKNVKSKSGLQEMDVRNNTNGQNMHECLFCGKILKVNYKYELHIRSHTGEKPCVCDLCGKSFAREVYLASHKKTHSEITYRKYECKFCYKTCESPSKLEYHTRSHTKEKPFKCDVCNKYYISKGELSRHRRREHDREKPHPCHLCEKSFFERSDLQVHIKRHLGIKPFLCHQCGWNFCTVSALSRHLRTHTGEKPYSCEICDKTFTRNEDLKKHIRSHIRKNVLSVNYARLYNKAN